jgi:hypothetical protein
MHMAKDVDVVCCTIDLVQMAFFIPKYSGYVSIEVFSSGVCETGSSVFGAKNNVIVDLKIGIHGSQFFLKTSIFLFTYPYEPFYGVSLQKFCHTMHI